MRSIKRVSSKKRMLILSLLILLLSMSIGYAYLSEAIKINTSANIGKIIWDVHLENIVVREGSVSTTPPIIGSDRTSITLSVALNQPNEYYEYYVDIVNKGSIDAQVDSIFKTSLTTEQEKYIDYKITYKDGLEIKRNDVLASGEKETLKVLVYIKDLHESLYPSINTNLTLEGRINYIQKNNDGIIRNKNSLYEQIVKETQSDVGINFGAISSDTNGKGVYTFSRTANYAYPIYYYRGDVQNNNVLFGNFCWKILRTTTTGGVKLIYNGTPNNGVCNNVGEASEIGKSIFNIEDTGAKYVGYMYDNNTTNSTIKTIIDEWFENNLLDYQEYLEDTPFYNERDYVVDEKSGIRFAPRIRNWRMTESNIIIKLGAKNVEDVFTVNSSIGNGALTYPVGLISSDEALLAGEGVYFSSTDTGANTNCFLSSNSAYWTLSPDLVFLDMISRVLFVGPTGIINSTLVHSNAGIRVVLSLQPGTNFLSGDGTVNTPYLIK